LIAVDLLIGWLVGWLVGWPVGFLFCLFVFIHCGRLVVDCLHKLCWCLWSG